MTVSYTESCSIWNVPNDAFPHLASSIHQPTIPLGIVILAIDKCTTDVKKIIKKSLHRGSTAATPEVSSKLANSHKPLSGIWLPTFNPWQECEEGQETTRNSDPVHLKAPVSDSEFPEWQILEVYKCYPIFLSIFSPKWHSTVFFPCSLRRCFAKFKQAVLPTRLKKICFILLCY